MRWYRYLAHAVYIVLVFSSCDQEALIPRALEGPLVCSFCRMVIDRPQYRAWMVDGRGERKPFDHPICMVRYTDMADQAWPGYRDGVESYTVTDAVTLDPVEAGTARYVHSKTLHVIMDYAVMATSHDKAASLADSVGGRILTFDDLWLYFAEPEVKAVLRLREGLLSPDSIAAPSWGTVRLTIENRDADSCSIGVESDFDVDFGTIPPGGERTRAFRVGGRGRRAIRVCGNRNPAGWIVVEQRQPSSTKGNSP